MKEKTFITKAEYELLSILRVYTSFRCIYPRICSLDLRWPQQLICMNCTTSGACSPGVFACKQTQTHHLRGFKTFELPLVGFDFCPRFLFRFVVPLISGNCQTSKLLTDRRRKSGGAEGQTRGSPSQSSQMPV